MRMRLLPALLAALPAALNAQTSAAAKPAAPATSPRGNAVFLYAYRPKPGQEAAFAAGYKRHLDWHRRHADSLSWLAWYIADGDRLDTFVNGVFGVTFRAMDVRVDVAADGEDADRNVNAYADPVWRDVYRVRADLGSSTQLEQGRPAPMQRVAHVTLHPGREAAFERALRSAAATLHGVAVYELVSGGEHATYMIVVQLPAWSALEDGRADPVRRIMQATAASVARARYEVWRHEPDMTYLAR